MITLQVPASLKSRLAQGHPWIYRNQIHAAPDLSSGTWVRVRSGTFQAYGLWDAETAIAVRLFSREGVPGVAWVADRVAEAWQIRASVRERATTAYRWLYGEGDGLPGIVVDLYGPFAVIRSYTTSVANLVPSVADALHAHTRLEGILWRPPGGQVQPFWGRLPSPDLVVEEQGLLFQADLLAGQKTGLYFDHRENRRLLAAYCQGRTVLDCFSYTGAFALYALRGGAASITACDAAAPAIDAARRNFQLNGFDPAAHTFHVADCFDLLPRYVAEGRQFDVVVLDPPSLAQDRKSRHAAERAYVRLNRDALRCVVPGGILASASCTAQVSPSAFRHALAEASRQAGCRLLILRDCGQPSDHPVAAHFPEGRYLKFVLGRVLPQV